MNPNLQYAQAIHGRVTGRGTGIIDTIHLVEVARAIEQLHGAPGWKVSDEEAVKRWFAEYLDVDDHARVRHRRARHEEQSCDLLGDAGRRLRTPDRQ